MYAPVAPDAEVLANCKIVAVDVAVNVKSCSPHELDEVLKVADWPAALAVTPRAPNKDCI